MRPRVAWLWWTMIAAWMRLRPKPWTKEYDDAYSRFCKRAEDALWKFGVRPRR